MKKSKLSTRYKENTKIDKIYGKIIIDRVWDLYMTNLNRSKNILNAL